MYGGTRRLRVNRWNTIENSWIYSVVMGQANNHLPITFILILLTVCYFKRFLLHIEYNILFIQLMRQKQTVICDIKSYFRIHWLRITQEIVMLVVIIIFNMKFTLLLHFEAFLASFCSVMEWRIFFIFFLRCCDNTWKWRCSIAFEMNFKKYSNYSLLKRRRSFELNKLKNFNCRDAK